MEDLNIRLVGVKKPTLSNAMQILLQLKQISDTSTEININSCEFLKAWEDAINDIARKDKRTGQTLHEVFKQQVNELYTHFI